MKAIKGYEITELWKSIQKLKTKVNIYEIMEVFGP